MHGYVVTPFCRRVHTFATVVLLALILECWEGAHCCDLTVIVLIGITVSCDSCRRLYDVAKLFEALFITIIIAVVLAQLKLCCETLDVNSI